MDEASQCGIEGVPLFGFGEKMVIIGDDKQISPSNVGIQEDSVERLRKEYLFDYQFSASFHPDNSLFDHAKLRFGKGMVTLREHFRCMPEIIRFSNDLCYADTPLIPLRQFDQNRLPPLQSVFVENGFREGDGQRIINRPEAFLYPLTLLFVPIADVVRVTLYRLFHGYPLFDADKSHIHHKLMRAGLTQHQALAVILLITIGIYAINYMLYPTLSSTVIVGIDTLIYIMVNITINLRIKSIA